MALLRLLLVAFAVGSLVAQVGRPSIDGNWQGTLSAGAANLRLALHIHKSGDNSYTGTLDSLDQGAVIPIDSVQAEGDSIRLELKRVNGVYEGKVNEARSELTGTWTQGGPPLPLTFKRAEKAAETPPSATPAPAPLSVPVDVVIPIVPSPFIGGNKQHLVYELHITNFSRASLRLKRVEVLAGDAPLATFDETGLDRLLQRPGVTDAADKETIGAGLRAVVYMWITLDQNARIPASVRHRLTFDNGSIETAPLNVTATPPIALGPPLRGDNWLAANGPGNTSGHRRALIPIEGKARIAQRFAIDWVRLRSNGKTYEGDPKDNQNYRAYGSEVLAVADAAVAATKDGIPQNIPGPTSRAVPITLETIRGNHIVLDLGGGRYAFYAHLQPGSLKVKTGDRVRRGQVLGLVGNSGNSTEPHLHFHVTDGNSALGSEGLPYRLDQFEVTGEGWKAQPDHPAEKRTLQLPIENEVVRFTGQ